MRRIAVAVAVVVVALLAGCSSGEPDTAAQERVLDQYLTAVQAGDRGRLAELAGPHVDAAAAIDEKIRSVGGRPWSGVRVSWDRGEFAGLAAATIEASDPAGRPVRDSVTLTRAGDGWRVALGEAPDAEPPAATARP
ncbi:hypothetical protein [Spirilliplanes yamanashiensis]|uniref:DUF4878 domain-containing protein n=1 Tax=Spirilliplanes yamanashiensis TaxID=42233 RepID=A0A8J3Y9P0_9ACTN|nr:hypothetical protein [Spirilliplanes yamanashiensis]MDP9815519.1 hypothetical protein [Spirilliplanes yamanashiensis]GIJ03773.1 hypothetical protein Sya03_31250 [Spirilliplanes yamanashiensis]